MLAASLSAARSEKGMTKTPALRDLNYVKIKLTATDTGTL